MNPNNASEIVRRNAGYSLLEAAFLLVIGFMFFQPPSFSDNQTYVDHAVDILIWALRAGGCLSLGTAVLCWTGWRAALLLDSLASLLTGLGLLVPALIVLIDGSVIAILVAFCGIMCLLNARNTWSNYRLTAKIAGAVSSSPPLPEETTEESAPPPDPQAKAEAMDRLLSTKQARPAVPNKVDIRRKDEPVPDGFLAELGRQQDPKQAP